MSKGQWMDVMMARNWDWKIRSPSGSDAYEESAWGSKREESDGGMERTSVVDFGRCGERGVFCGERGGVFMVDMNCSKDDLRGTNGWTYSEDSANKE